MTIPHTDITPTIRPAVAGRTSAAAPRALPRANQQADGAASGEAPAITAEARREMIRKAAYRLAEERDFAPGGELQDWLAAEEKVDALIAVRLPPTP